MMATDVQGLSNEQLLEFYRRMCVIRGFEETVAELFLQGQIPGSVHLSTGQEATAVGVCAALREGDYIVTTHRGHGHLIARGADVKRMMAEILGRKTGLCQGKGGSLHVADFSIGIIGAMGIVAGGLPVATGAGLASKMKNDGKVAACFFGDGASNQGTFHESLNLAAAWSLPVIYVCENNLYGMTTHVAEVMSTRNVADRSAAYGIPGVVVDGNDILEVYQAAQEAVKRAASGLGPTLIECKTYRWRGHFEGEDIVFEGRMYRSQEEVDKFRTKDPIATFRGLLLNEGKVTEDQLAAVDREVRFVIDEAVQFAKESPLPAPEDSFESVFAG